MAYTSSHLRACNISASEVHNKREKKLAYVREDLKSLNESFSYIGERTLRDEEKRIKRTVKEKTGRKLQKNAIPMKEGVVLIKEDTTLEDLQNFCKRCKDELGITPLQIHIHKDEGHWKDMIDSNGNPVKDENGKIKKEWVPNLHAHIVWRMYDENGRNVRLQRGKCCSMQDIAAETLGMERGIPSAKSHLTSLQYKIQCIQMELDALEEEKKLNTARVKELVREISVLLAQRKQLEGKKNELDMYNSLFSKLGFLLSKMTDKEKTERIEELEAEIRIQDEKHTEDLLNASIEQTKALNDQYQAHKIELQESGDYKQKYEDLKYKMENSHNVRDAYKYKSAFEALPLIMDECKSHQLDFDFRQMQDLALGKVSTTPEYAGCRWSDVGESGDIEISYNKHSKCLVASTRRETQFWMKLEDWKRWFLDTLKRYKEKISQKVENKQTMVQKKGKSLSIP